MTHKKVVRTTFGQRASKYTASTCHTDPNVLARIVELSSPKPNWSVLDVATGTGHTAFAVAPYVSSVTGIDLTPEMLVEAEKLRIKRLINNVKFRTNFKRDVNRGLVEKFRSIFKDTKWQKRTSQFFYLMFFTPTNGDGINCQEHK